MTNDTQDPGPEDDMEEALPGPRTDEPGHHTNITTGAIAAELWDDTGDTKPINVRLDWSPQTPFEVMLAGQHSWSPTVVKWPFARELLVFGGGRGDVRITHFTDDVHVVLDSPERCAELLIPADPVNRFIDWVLAVVPIGEETSLATTSDQDWAAQLARMTSPATRARNSLLLRRFPPRAAVANTVNRAAHGLQRLARLIAKDPL